MTVQLVKKERSSMGILKSSAFTGAGGQSGDAGQPECFLTNSAHTILVVKYLDGPEKNLLTSVTKGCRHDRIN
jgi:hypothetical protein